MHAFLQTRHWRAGAIATRTGHGPHPRPHRRKGAAPPDATLQAIYSERTARGMALNLQTANHTEDLPMDMLIKQLKTVTAGRYHIITETSAEGLPVSYTHLTLPTILLV